MTPPAEPHDPERPLTRRELRERAGTDAESDAPAPDAAEAEAGDDGETDARAATDGRGAGEPGPEPDAPAASEPEVPAETESDIPAGTEPGERHTDADELLAAFGSEDGDAERDGADERAASETADEGAAAAEAVGDAAPTRRTFPAGGGIEELMAPEPEPEKKRRRGGGCLIALIIAVVLVGGLVGAGYWAWTAYGERVMEELGLDGPHDYEEGEATGEVVFQVEEGDTGESISPRLYGHGVTLEPDSFTRYTREEAPDLALYPGVYTLQEKMTSAAVADAFADPENRQEDAIALPEGMTVASELESIASSTEIPLEDLQSAAADPAAYGVDADSLEGWLFPATYSFDPGVTAEEVIRTMVDRTRESLAAAGVPDEDAHDVLTIASIIQREARFEQDFYQVSRVIQNRLGPDTWGDTAGFLQMDSTAQYGYGETHSGTASSSAEALADDNPWNTYAHKGLPAGPIANPGDLAIDAAMHPADGPWLYFVTVDLSTGETKYATNNAEHEQNVDEWQAWCAANPDGGC
ncbi:endolytic transglycosylase MltG [Microbacterium halophytorum]|uniref:endolytic transglycosylase MltG n=1 Tax=Microbacterium halophytorum TaxID=2067568 RepID=UPI000CFC1B93|nr:endolytic transglycosylase MltG [Microbacterium halophytorum]